MHRVSDNETPAAVESNLGTMEVVCPRNSNTTELDPQQHREMQQHKASDNEAPPSEEPQTVRVESITDPHAHHHPSLDQPLLPSDKPVVSGSCIRSDKTDSHTLDCKLQFATDVLTEFKAYCNTGRELKIACETQWDRQRELASTNDEIHRLKSALATSTKQFQADVSILNPQALYSSSEFTQLELEYTQVKKQFERFQSAGSKTLDALRLEFNKQRHCQTKLAEADAKVHELKKTLTNPSDAFSLFSVLYSAWNSHTNPTGLPDYSTLAIVES
jgi:hypothetical protein